MTSIDELLPPIEDKALTISPSALAQFIRFEQCQRLFRLDLHTEEARSNLFQKTDTKPEHVSPLLSATGNEWEVELRDLLINAGWTVFDPQNKPTGELESQIRRTCAGQRRIVTQATLSGDLDGWHVRAARPDVIVVDRAESGQLRLMVADLKSTREVRLEHRLQVAMYAMLLAQQYPDAEISEAIIYRVPIDAPESWSDDQHYHRDAARTILNLSHGAMLAVAERSERYHDQIRRTILAHGSLAREMAAALFTTLPFHVSSKCDGCRYSQVCLKTCRLSDDLSLIPHMAERTKRSLRATGIATIEALSDVRTANRAAYARLIANPSVAGQLSELVQRADTYRAWRDSAPRLDTWLRESGHSTLPAANAQLHSNLIKVYVDLQVDANQGRVYLAGALISCLVDGEERLDRQRSVLEMLDGPPATDAAEACLIQSWLQQILHAISALSGVNEDGERKAPLHFYLWDDTQLGIFENLVNRQHDAVFGIEAVMELMMQLAAFDSNNVSIVAAEVRGQRALPILCQSLQAVAPWFGYRWPDSLRTMFRYRLFDALQRESDHQAAHLVPLRARFRSDLPAEYAYVTWNAHQNFRSMEQPVGQTHGTAWGLYGHPTREDIVAFQAARLQALRTISDGLRANNRARKSSFDLQALNRRGVRPERPIEAVLEFIAVERHQELSEWRRIRSVGQDQRVVRGESLVVQYRDDDQVPEIRIRIREARERHARWEATKAFDKDARKGKDDKWSLSDLDVRLNVAVSELPDSLHLETVLLNTRIKADSFVTLAPARMSFTSAETGEEADYQTTARQILHGFRGQVTQLTTDGAIVVNLRQNQRTFAGFVTRSTAGPFEDGEILVIDSSPDSWPWKRQWDVASGIQAGHPHAAYAYIAGAGHDLPEWTEREADGQRRFLDGLELLATLDSRIPEFEPSKHELIGTGGAEPMTLVQGPPGTGKSTTTGFALWSRMQGALASGREFRVAVACKTHSATDVLVSSILKAQQSVVDIARNRGPEVNALIDQRLGDIPVYRYEPKDTPPSGSRLVKGGTTDAHLKELLTHNRMVVGGTTNAISKLATKAWRDGNPPWDLVIVDEASQMSLPEFLVASIGLKPDGRMIVVGDHRQMPPIIKANWEEGDTIGLDPYAAYRSVFDVIRFHSLPKREIKFTESFRINRDIAEYLYREVYQFDGISFFSKRNEWFSRKSDRPFIEAVLGSVVPLVLITHDERDSQQRNGLEQKLVETLVLAIREVDDRLRLGVVVPHRAQLAALRKSLMELTGDQTLADSVNTIERFQGNEREVIIYSATESDPAYIRDTGTFLFDSRRLTVALSRATRKLIVIASESIFTYLPQDEESLENTAIWRNLREYACPEIAWVGSLEGYRITVRKSAALAPRESEVLPH